MDRNEVGLVRLKLLQKLMKMYSVGAGKQPNHKDDKGNYEIIFFIKDSLKLLAEKENSPIFQIPDKFIEEFFTCLFKHRIDE